MNFDDAKSRIEELKAIIKENNEAYYVFDSPKITDFEYDELYRELKRLEEEFPELITTDSPTQKVGDKTAKGFNEIQHKYRLYSLDNSNNYEDLRKWYDRVKKEYENESDLELVVEKTRNHLLYFMLAEAYQADNQIDRAIGAYLKTIMLNEKFALPYKKLGMLFLSRDDKISSIEYFEDYLKLDIPEDEKISIAKLLDRIKNEKH